MFSIEVNHYIHPARGTNDVDIYLAKLKETGDKIMATLQDVQAALLAAAEAATAEKAEVQVALDALTVTITDLQNVIASGTGVTAADLGNLVTTIAGITAQVQDITVPTVVA